MECKGIFKTPLERQVNEALRIKHSKADQRMNSGAEWRADSRPRASYSAPGLENRRKHKTDHLPSDTPSGCKTVKLTNPIPLELIQEL